MWVHTCMWECALLSVSLSPSACWNMNACCYCPPIPLAVLLQSPAYRDELWQGNSGGMGLLQKPFLLLLIVCHPELIGSRTLTDRVGQLRWDTIEFCKKEPDVMMVELQGGGRFAEIKGRKKMLKFTMYFSFSCFWLRLEINPVGWIVKSWTASS